MENFQSVTQYVEEDVVICCGHYIRGRAVMLKSVSVSVGFGLVWFFFYFCFFSLIRIALGSCSVLVLVCEVPVYRG